MPQVDLETLVTACAGGINDRKIVCETLAHGCADDAAPKNDVISGEYGQDNMPPDFPPESFYLSKDAEYEWFDRNAFFERKESTKGNMPRSNSSNSQRFSVNLKSRASIIGLPKTQKATFADSKRRTCKPANMSLFPKRSESAGKSRGPMVEPGSPKVSCMGRVRSKRCRRRSNSLKRSEKPVEKSRSGREKQKAGLYSKVMSMFRSKKSHKKTARSGTRKVGEAMDEPAVVEARKKSVNVTVIAEPVAEPPALGGMKRFVSGRRSGSWTGEEINPGD